MTDDLTPATTEDAGPPARRRYLPRRKRWKIPLALLAVFTVALAVVFLRLLSGPVYTEIGTGRVAAAMAGAAGDGATASVGVVGVGLSPDFSPIIHLRDLRIDRPGATGSLDTLEVATTWATLAGLERRFTSVSSDHVFLETAGSGGAVPAVPELLAALDGGLERTGLSHVDVGALTLRRRLDDGGSRPVLDQVAVTASRGDDDRLTARLAGAGASGPWFVAATVAPGAEPGARAVDIGTQGLDLADLGTIAGTRPAAPSAARDGADRPPAEPAAAAAPPPVVSGPVAFTGRIGFSADGVVTSGDGTLMLGPVRTPESQDTPILDRSRVSVRWRPEDRTVVVDPSTVALPSAPALVAGTVALPAAGGTRWPFRFRVVAKDPATGRDKAGGLLAGSYDPSSSELVVDNLQAQGEGAAFSAALRLSHQDGHLIGALSGIFPEMSVDTLKTIWPPFVVQKARDWVNGHVFAGTIRDATVDLSVADEGLGTPSAGDQAEAGVSFRFEDLAFRPMDDGPVIRGGRGTGRLVEDRFEVLLDAGRVDLGEGRALDVTGASFVIPVVSKDPADGAVRLDLAGPADAAVALWSTLPLARGVTLPVKPDEVSGRARASISATMPLLEDIPADLVAYSGEIVLENVTPKVPVEGRAISDANLTIRLAEGAATVSGTAKVDGVAAEVDIWRPLSGGGAGTSAVRLVMTEDDRRKLGIDLGSAVRGPVTVSLVDEKQPDGSVAKRATVDLARADVRVPPLGFRKAKGASGTARFLLRTGDGRTRIDDVSVEMGEARIEGSLVLDADGLVSGDFPRVRIDKADRLDVALARSADGLKVTVTGSRFDARGLIRNLLQAADDDADGPAVPLVLDVGIDTIRGFGDEDLAGVNIASRVEKGVTTALSFAAQTAGGGSASATITPRGRSRALQIEAGEVGRLLRFLDLYPRVFGGRARIAGEIDRTGVVRARVDGSRWRIVEEPALARLSTAATSGPTAGFTTAEIERLILDLQFGAGRLVIDDGIVRADAAGLTLQGDVDFRRDALRLSGSYLPASQLDSLIGKIPILGQTLFAGGRAGLFGVTFRLTGPIDEPNLTVNPLSIIAPGIFRKIFELQ